MNQLRQFIFWTSIGREGALHFKEQLRRKKMAEHLHESVAGGISVEKVQKMIKRYLGISQIGRTACLHLMCLCVLFKPHCIKSCFAARLRLSRRATKSELTPGKPRVSPRRLAHLGLVGAAAPAVGVVVAVDAVAGVVVGVVARAPARRVDPASGLLLCP